MMIEKALKRLQSAEEQMLPLLRLRTHTAFQPRNERILPFKDRNRARHDSKSQLDSLRLKLESAQQGQLDPVLVVEISDSGQSNLSDGLYVVDGHHRLDAYRQARRETIPARVCSMDFRTAVLVSKLVNCVCRALEMHPFQRRDAAWQYIAEMTQRGAVALPDGESLRVIGGRFSISKNTVASMLSHLKEVADVSEYIPQAIDPGTGWPRWRYVVERNSYRQDKENLGTEDRRTQRRAEKLVRTILAYTQAERALAFELMKRDDKHAAHEVEEAADFRTEMKSHWLDVEPRLSQLGH